MPESLSPQERIRKKRDFLFLYKKGYRYRGKYFNLVYLSNGLNFSRMAVVASKKIGNAIVRNKVKRWMRTLFRRNKNIIGHSLDIIIIIKQRIWEASWVKLQEDYLGAIKSITSNKSA
jgi:ribonuclease P protein component